MPISAWERSAVLSLVAAAHDDFVRRFPLHAGARQPVHVLYGGLHLFTADTPAKLGQLARTHLATFAPDAATLARVFDLATPIATEVLTRVHEKLTREPIEDLRLDAEDGYGHRADDEEDANATKAGEEVKRLLATGHRPPFLGLRIKPLSKELAPRALRTLDRFFDALGTATPPGFLVTLPKVTDPRQLRALVLALEAVEAKHRLAPGTIRIEAMVESGPGLFDDDGRCTVPMLVEAGQGRLFAAHVGAYDFTASLDVVASRQRLDHPSLDFLRQLLKVSLAGTGIFLADGATTQLPLAPHKGDSLTDDQRRENDRVVHAAWKAHFTNISRALDQGFFQGWDLHPGQLVPRYVATFAFFLEARDAMTKRLKHFIEQLGRATSVGDVFDDAATGQGLLNFFLRGRSCGALTEEEVLATGLTLEELRSRDFGHIMKARRS
jgi:citrate lyase beta subunit